MSISDGIISIVKTYIKKGESYKVLDLLEFNRKQYKEVKFIKRSFMKSEIKGYLYIDSENNIITSKNIQREIGKLAYFYDTFFRSEKGVGIAHALSTEEDMRKNEDEFNNLLKGLEFMEDQRVRNIPRVKDAVLKLQELREKSNETIQEFLKASSDIKNSTKHFNEEAMASLYPKYEEILKLNFEKVKLISTLKDCLDEVKDSAEKMRKKLANRFNKNLVSELMKVSYEMSYFIRIIKTYKSVLSLNTSQYIKFLKDKNKENIESRINLVRV